jgi:hypothetical protein
MKDLLLRIDEEKGGGGVVSFDVLAAGRLQAREDSLLAGRSIGRRSA